MMSNEPDYLNSDVNTYLNYITSEHRNKPKFVATVGISSHPYVTLQGVLRGLIPGFDVDKAVGKQLDIIGEWVGQSRQLVVPLKDVYFAYNGSEKEGWESGIWWHNYDPSTGIKTLDDDSYRFLIKLKIAANAWHGKRSEAYDIWEGAFGEHTFVLITDYQDMSIEMGFSGAMPAPVRALLQAGLNPFKPESVRVKTYFISNTDGPMFGWDIANEAINGWDTASWSSEVLIS